MVTIFLSTINKTVNPDPSPAVTVGHNYTFPFEIFFEIPLNEPTTSNPSDNKVKIITGAVLGSLAVVVGVAGGTVLYSKKRKK